MSDETNENTPQTDGSGQSDGVSPGLDAAAAAQAAADIAAQAAAAAEGDPIPSEADERAVDAAAASAEQTRAEAQAAIGEPDDDSPTRFNLETFDASFPEAAPGSMSLLDDVNLDVKIELGRTRMFVEDVLKLNNGAVVELDKLAGDPVDIYVNNRHVARGEVLVLNDNFCVRISEILDPSLDDSKK